MNQINNMMVRGWCHFLAAAVTALTLLLLASCASPSARTGAADTAGDAVAAREYRIGPGDQLNVFVFGQPDLSVNVPVRPDGLISTPLVENMGAAGKTPSELGRDIETVLADYVRAPKVNIIVTSFVGTYGDQIRVVGQAAHPQALSYRSGMTLLDVMIAVGGLTEFAAGQRARLVRHVDGKVVEMRVNVKKLVNDGDISANIAMQPGDVLIIPQSRF
jgi:polysaccharide export outer membrane protein